MKEAGRPGWWKNNNQTIKVSDLDENETNSLTGTSVILHRAFNANKFHFYHFGIDSEDYRQFETVLLKCQIEFIYMLQFYCRNNVE